MEAIAKYDLTTTSDGELSFKKGNMLKIVTLDSGYEHWYKAESDGKEGFVPDNYLNFSTPKWFKGKITREQADNDLMEAGTSDGRFLIRESESSPGDYSLSVRYGDQVEHFKVLRDTAGSYFLWVVKFSSLNQLVEYHRMSSVSRSQQILLKVEDCVEAGYDFEGEGKGELTFKKGDIITVLKKIDANWWEGTLNGQCGVFPVNYIIEL